MAWLLVAIGAAAQNSAPRMTKASAEVRPKTTFNCTLPQELVPPKEQSSEDALPALSNLLLTNVILPRRKKGDHSYTLFAELLSKHFGDPPRRYWRYSEDQSARFLEEGRLRVVVGERKVRG